MSEDYEQNSLVVESQSSLNEATNSVINYNRSDSKREERICWVCLGTDKEDSREIATHHTNTTNNSNTDNTRQFIWVQPCKCSGTSKWVHQSCLLKWIDTKKQETSFSMEISCPQCLTPYKLENPETGDVFLVIDLINQLINAVSPFASIGAVCGFLYVGAVCFGGLTVCQLIGTNNGLNLLNNTKPAVLLTLLPLVPFGLVAPRIRVKITRAVVYENNQMNNANNANNADNNNNDNNNNNNNSHLQIHINRENTDNNDLARTDQDETEDIVHIVAGRDNSNNNNNNNNINNFNNNNNNNNNNMIVENNHDNDNLEEEDFEFPEKSSLSRAVVGGLMLPSIARLVGTIVFKPVLPETLHHSLMGGALFLGIKGLIKMYYRNKIQFIRSHRRVLNYGESR